MRRRAPGVVHSAVPEEEGGGETRVPKLFPGKIQNDLWEHRGGVTRDGTAQEASVEDLHGGGGVCTLRGPRKHPALFPWFCFTPADAGESALPQIVSFCANVSETPWEIFLEGNDLEPRVTGFL